MEKTFVEMKRIFEKEGESEETIGNEIETEKERERENG